ncbi:hypothetical protein HWI79_3476 [Cryptosporidium felis]|nr:hypothetical protein HWI79_3476 [Cryptosporidium felis]
MKILRIILLFVSICLFKGVHSSEDPKKSSMEELSRMIRSNQEQLEFQQRILERQIMQQQMLQEQLLQSELFQKDLRDSKDQDDVVTSTSTITTSTTTESTTTTSTTTTPTTTTPTTTTPTTTRKAAGISEVPDSAGSISSPTSQGATEESGPNFERTGGGTMATEMQLKDRKTSDSVDKDLQDKISALISANLAQVFKKLGLESVSKSLFPNQKFQETSSRAGTSSETRTPDERVEVVGKAGETQGAVMPTAIKSAGTSSFTLVPGVFSEDQLFILEGLKIYPVDKVGTRGSLNKMQYLTGKDINTVITSCKHVAMNWVMDLAVATRRIFEILVIGRREELRFKSNIVLTESRLLNVYTNCDLLIGNKSSQSPRSVTMKFPKTKQSVLDGYRGQSLKNIKKKQISRMKLYKAIESFAMHVSSYNHLNLCSTTGFDIARASLRAILLEYLKIVKIDIKRLEIALVKSKL